MKKPKLYDIIMSAGLVGTFIAYYAEKAHHFVEDLGIRGELYHWTVGGLPEFFTGAVGIRLGDAILNFASKKIQPLKNYAVRTGLTAAGIIGLGTLDEVVVNISGGTQDPWDIAKYAAGVSVSIAIGAVYNKKSEKDKKLENLT